MPAWTKTGVVCAAMVIAAVPSCTQAPLPPRVIPLDLSGKRPTAMLSVEGHGPVAVIFDTGAGTNLFSRATAQSLGLPDLGGIKVGSPGSSAPITGFQTRLRSAELGEAVIADAAAVVVDLPASMSDISGIISPYTFSGRLLRFEFAAARAVVVDRTPQNTPTSQAYAYGGEAGQPLPAVEIEIGGRRLVAHLDSGSQFGLDLPLVLATSLPLAAPPVATTPVHMVNADHAAYTATIRGVVRIGPLTLTDPDVLFVDGQAMPNVGYRILKRLTVVLDPGNRRDWVLLPP